MLEKANAKQIRSALKNTPGALKFIQMFFKALKAANPGREERDHDRERRALDTMAWLLVGDEVCSAVALSGANLLCATNRNLHQDDFFTYHLKFRLVRKFVDSGVMVIKITGTLNDNGTREINAESDDHVIIRWIPAQGEFIVVEGSGVVRFKRDHHLIDGINHDIVITIRLGKGKDITEEEYRRILIQMLHEAEEDQEINLTRKNIPVEWNPLRRRVQTLINIIALIARVTMQRPDLKDKVMKLVHKQRPLFLNASLSYELSEFKEFQDHIKPYDFSHSGMNTMLEFYDQLIQDYEQYKLKHQQVESVESITAWADEVAGKLRTKALAYAPAFIQTNAEKFIEKGLPYFIKLIQLEKFVEWDAQPHRQGKLATLLVKESLFTRPVTLKVIDGPQDNLHAEIRLLEEHLREGGTLDSYFGITKLCCALCTYTMKQFGIAEHRYRGASSKIWENWVLSSLLASPPHLATFLGDLAFLYDGLAGKTMRIPKHGGGTEEMKQQDAVKTFIQLIGLVNYSLSTSKNAREELGIPESDLLPLRNSAGSLYAVDPAEEKEDKKGHGKSLDSKEDTAPKTEGISSQPITTTLPHNQSSSSSTTSINTSSPLGAGFFKLKNKSAEEYILRLQFIVGKQGEQEIIQVVPDEKASGSKTVYLPSFWLKQLGEDAIRTLSNELDIDPAALQSSASPQKQ